MPKRPRFPMDYYVPRLRGREYCSPGVARALLIKHLAFLFVKEESSRKQGDKIRADRILAESTALAQMLEEFTALEPTTQATMFSLFTKHLAKLRELPWAKLKE